MKYTVGNPLGYEKALDDGPTHKQVGGIVFDTFTDAYGSLVDGMLNPAWFDDGVPRPGRVYALQEPVEVCRDHYAPGQHYLKAPALVVRVPLASPDPEGPANDRG